MSVVAGVEAQEVTPGADQPPVSMVERMTLILGAFRRPTDTLILEDVARLTGLPRSTVHRIIDQLVRLDWLRHYSNGYCLGPRALSLGGGERAHEELRSQAAPVLHDLAITTGLVVHLGVLQEDRVLYLDKIGGRRAVGIPSRVGATVAAHATALGKAMLAWLPPEEVEARLVTPLPARTSATLTSLEDLYAEMHRIRGRGGLTFERGECFRGIACAAAAVRGPDRPLGAISVVGRADTSLDRVAPLVVEAARTVSIEMFGGLQPAGRRRGGSR